MWHQITFWILRPVKTTWIKILILFKMLRLRKEIDAHFLFLATFLQILHFLGIDHVGHIGGRKRYFFCLILLSLLVCLVVWIVIYNVQKISVSWCPKSLGRWMMWSRWFIWIAFYPAIESREIPFWYVSTCSCLVLNFKLKECLI